MFRTTERTDRPSRTIARMLGIPALALGLMLSTLYAVQPAAAFDGGAGTGLQDASWQGEAGLALQPVGFKKRGFHGRGFKGFHGRGFKKHGFFKKRGFHGHAFKGHGFKKPGVFKKGFHGHAFKGHGHKGHGVKKHGLYGHRVPNYGYKKHHGYGYRGHGFKTFGFKKHGVVVFKGHH